MSQSRTTSAAGSGGIVASLCNAMIRRSCHVPSDAVLFCVSAIFLRLSSRGRNASLMPAIGGSARLLPLGFPSRRASFAGGHARRDGHLVALVVGT
jgi:hypothetical protein